MAVLCEEFKASQLVDERLHGAKARVSQGVAQAFGCVASLIEMMIVKECIELSMYASNERVAAETQEVAAAASNTLAQLPFLIQRAISGPLS